MAILALSHSSTAVFVGVFTATSIAMMYYIKRRSDKNLPPCIRSVPVLGSLPFLPHFSQLSTFFMQKAKELGPVMAVYLGQRYAVVLVGRDAIHEALVKRSFNFASRPSMFVQKLANPSRRGFLIRPFDSGYKKYHQLSLNILKKFGFGQNIMEDRIQIEVADLVKHVRQQNGASFNPDHLITGSVANVTINILLGERWEHHNSYLEKLIEITHSFVQLTQKTTPISMFPVLRHLPSKKKVIRTQLALNQAILDLCNEQIDAGLRKAIPECFVSHFLEMEGDEFKREELLYILRDLFLAGGETTSNTLLFAIVLLANHPDIQSRVRQEIDSVVPRDRLPSLDDKKALQFVECVTLEVMRLKTILCISLFHETIGDVWLKGFFIPKETLIIPVLHSAHMDDKVWDSPENFNPDRFLDESGQIVKREEVIPFSLGKRSCLGEVLARQEVFLFITGLLQNFEILPPEGETEIRCDEIIAVTRSPGDFKARFIPRKF